MNNIINYLTKECYGIVKVSEEGKKHFIAYIAGATIYVALPRDLYIKAKDGEAFKGQIHLIKKEMINPEKIGKIKASVYSTYTRHGGSEGQEQSERQPIDAYLVKCKHSLYRQGHRAGTKFWNDELDEATSLWNVVHGTDFPRSKDTKKWF